ncbi:hypothetical protein [Clostridium septicum]|uniref:tRNA (Guanine-N1)-methyltransferase n=1 Tax=Clostridium septicum TaxID=1504 RepID=A0A9N7PJR5_CLOSE|nr:hypothetical protein [Clostridium septicum]AYE35051.1 hypothetical protein CP523_11850 [Clostridium septicum]MDU1312640.1 hypothetical protein [Clostridium septicum]QAS60444.1 hypothetical protein EI377_06670 [Clostridium septicum]UEC20299.1 hypothetical protein LK444_12960 [Clostridium septicum]USS01649.1 hypothetical protein NH397_04225 [Clostridium septicum]
MAKPSIFSKEYNSHMKKRKRNRNILISSIILLVIIGLGVFKFNEKLISFSDIKMKIQSLFNKGEETLDEKNKDTEVIHPNIDEQVKEESKKDEKKILELSINGDRKLKMEYEEKDNKRTFKDIVEMPQGIYYDISPLKEFLLIIDENQNINLFNTKGEAKNITSPTYVAPNGEKFEKDTILKIYKEHIWNKDAKFISNTKVAYISNIPYFGYNLNKYIWIVDIQNNTHTTLWNSKAKDIEFLGHSDKGLEVTINGNKKYINDNGQLIN